MKKGTRRMKRRNKSKTNPRSNRSRVNRSRVNRSGGSILSKFYLLAPDEQGYRPLYLILEHLDNDEVNAWSFPPTQYPLAEYSVRGLQIDSLPMSILNEEIELDTLERDGTNKVLSGLGVKITFPDQWWKTNAPLWKSILKNYKIKDVR
jgi:hypothetical protein